MAVKYVYSAAAGAGTGADWTNAYTTLALAFAGMSAGDTAYVAHDHAETQASTMTLTSPGTAASPCRVICVNRAGTVPPVSADLRTTATITTTSTFSMSFGNGYGYYYGVIFSAGSGVASNTVGITGDGKHTFKSCAFKKLGTVTTTLAIAIGSSTSGVYCDVVFDNTTVQFGNTGDRLAVRAARFRWVNTPSAITGAVFPTNLFGASANVPTVVQVEGVDLSALGSTILVTAQTAGSRFTFKDCKLGSGFVVSATQTFPTAGEVTMIRCDSGDTNYKTEKHASYVGKQTTETTIVRSAGASDATTPISWKIETTADAEWVSPFECLPIGPIWNETTGSAITITVEGVWDAGAVPNDDEIWMDVEYLGTSGFPLGSFASEGKADILASGAGQDSSSVTWTTTGLSTPVKFKLVKQVTPQEKGPFTVYVKAAKTSSTFYIDPKVTVS